MSTMRVAADGELARLLGARAVRVAEIVQPLDQLPRRSAPGRGAARTAGRTRADRPAAISPCIRASIIREKATQ